GRAREDAFAVRLGRRDSDRGRGGVDLLRRDRRASNRDRGDREDQDEGRDDDAVEPVHRVVVRRSGITGFGGAPATTPGRAPGQMSWMTYEATEKRTNRTSSRIVNCHSRRSMPRRLR